MADPKTTNRFVSTDSKFDFYANVISHAELYANNISANSFNVGSQTLEEYIQIVGGGGGSGDVTNNYVTATFVSNNYLEDIKSTFGTGDVTNNYLTATFSSNNYVQDILDTKATNTYVNSTFSSNNYIQDILDTKATNTYVNSTFTSNNYVDGRFSSNTYVTSKIGLRATNTYVNSTFVSNNYLDGKFTSNSFIVSTFASNNYIQDHVATEVAALVDSAPSTLDTLNELAAALGDDANFATTITNKIGLRATNTYVNDTFSSNNYLQDQLDLKATNTYVNSTFTSNNYVEGRFVSNTYVTTRLGIRATNTYVQETFTSNNYVQDVLDTKATNTYVNSTFTSNNYVDGRFTSNTYVTSKIGLRATNTYVNSTFTSNNYVDGRFTSNSFVKDTFTSNNYVQTQLDLKATNTYVNSTFTSNNYVDGRFTSNNYVESQLSNKVSTTHAGDVSITGNVTITSTEDGSSAGPDLILYRNSASPNDGDYIGQIQFKGRQDGPGDEIYAKVTGKIRDATNGTEDGLIETAIKGNGTFTIVSRQKSNELQLLNGVGLSVDGSIAVGGTVDGRDIASDGSTLDSISSTYASNNYLVTTFASNNYLQDRLTAFGSGDVSNNYLTNHFTTNNYIQTYVSSEISSLVDSAPTTLDTLNELAAALGDDPNFATTVTNQIGIRATNTYVNSTFSSNNYVTGNFVSNNYLTAGQISNINVSQLQVGEEDSAAGGVLTVYGRQTGETVGGEIRLHTAADYDTNIPYYAIKTSGEDFVIELNGGTDVITIDYSTGAVDVPTGRVDLGLSDNTYGELRLYGNGTGSSQGGLIRMYTAADYDTSIDFYNMKVTADDWHLEKGTGEDIISYYGGSNELRFGATLAYVSVGASDSSKGSLYLWSDGTGSVNGGELRIYNAPDHDTNVNYYSIYAESGDLLISYGSTDFLQYDETASQWLMPRSGGLDVTGNITTSGTVDGRDVAADGSKLDGIESGATADQTASEILTAIKTVDGSGSGLNADLLDGQQGSYYLNTSTSFGGDVSGTYNNIVVTDDSHSHSNYLINNGNATTTGYLQAEGFVGSGGTGTHILAPHGAHYATNTSTVTGAIKVTLPQSWTNTMLRFTVKVYEYASGESFDIVCAGYNYNPSTTWINTSAYILGDPTVSRNFNVRFGHDGSKCCVYIGETSSTWSYPQVMVSEFYAGYSNYSIEDWNDNWDISFATSFGTITRTESNNEIGRYVDNNIVWHAGNDGSGSGLDADLLDGIHATGLVSNNYFQDNSGGGGGATGGGSDKIFYNNDQTVTTSYTIPSGQNSMTAGPISINSGVTVTVPSGSEWTIV